MKKVNWNAMFLSYLQKCREKGWVIDPFHGMQSHAEDFVKLGFCPCDKTRSRHACPCPESDEEVEQDGHCLCHLFWKDLAFVEIVMRTSIEVKRIEEMEKEDGKENKKEPV